MTSTVTLTVVPVPIGRSGKVNDEIIILFVATEKEVATFEDGIIPKPSHI